MNSELKQVYDNTYTSYESERQSRTDRAEAKKKKKNENIHKQLKKREDCLKKAVVTKGSELEKIVDSVYGYGSECFIKIGKLKLRYWWCKKS